MREKALVAAVAIVAVVRAATGGLPAKSKRVIKPMTSELARSAYYNITSRERSMRREAAVKFPGDLWSQDDDFHERENEATVSFAKDHEVAVADVILAIDDGMKQRWPTSSPPQATVPPCRPRLAY